MIHLANILVVTDSNAQGLDLLSKLRRHGYDGRLVPSVDAAVATAQQEHPDVILLGDSIEGGTPIALAQAICALPTCAEIPLCLFTAEPTGANMKAAFDAGISDVIGHPLSETKLLARLRPLVRLSTMFAELHQRARTARRFGIDAEDSVPDVDALAGFDALIVGRNLPEVRSALDNNARVVHVDDPYLADNELEKTFFDVALILPTAEQAPFMDLCVQIRNNPRLFNLPVLLLAPAGQLDDEQAYQHGASGRYDLPVDQTTLATAARVLVKRQRRRWAIRGLLQKTLQVSTRDASTGVYNRPFVDAYLSDQIEFAQIHGRHLSIMFFRIPDVEGIRQRFGQEQADHLRLQLAQWISGLLRGEDLVARYEENEFCVILPDTPKGEADVVMHRIAGVLTYTDFAVKDVYQPVKVWVRTGSADLDAEDDLHKLVARARRDIV